MKAFFFIPTFFVNLFFQNFLRGEPSQAALLGVSSLVSTFCSQHENCQQLPEVQAIVARYEELLGSNCSGIDRVEEDGLILALKGLRNIGFLTNQGHQIVEKCYLDSYNSMFLRLAALDTIRHLNCQPSEHDFNRQLFTTFSNSQGDSELRIGAYLAIMGCPSSSMVDLVKGMLVNEPVNQVGSFVWTHLTNLQESRSMSDHKKAMKALIGSDFLQNKWKTDVRKFSRYFETSHYSDHWKVGGTADGQLIFSQDSYLPKSAMINLTANVFGENLHLLELGTRMEGFEPFFEQLFGPDGYFREDSLHKLLQSLRQRRHVSEAISGFQQTYNQDFFNAVPKGNMYMRTFGRDLHYSSFEGLPNLFSGAWPMSWMMTGSNVDYRRSSIFLDGKIVVPTVAGMPLTLAVNGTSAINLKSENNFDLVNFFRTGDADIHLGLFPTATLQVSQLSLSYFSRQQLSRAK